MDGGEGPEVRVQDGGAVPLGTEGKVALMGTPVKISGAALGIAGMVVALVDTAGSTAAVVSAVAVGAIPPKLVDTAGSTAAVVPAVAVGAIAGGGETVSATGIVDEGATVAAVTEVEDPVGGAGSCISGDDEDAAGGTAAKGAAVGVGAVRTSGGGSRVGEEVPESRTIRK